MASLNFTFRRNGRGRSLRSTRTIKKMEASLERIRMPLALGYPVSFCDWCNLPCPEKDMKYGECTKCVVDDSILRAYYLKCKWCPKVEFKCLECHDNLVE